MSLYERLVRGAWRLGRYSIDPQRWSEPPAITPTRGARETVRAEIERIIVNEGAPRALGKENRMKLAKFVKFREEKFGGVLFETRQEKVYTLNPTGTAVVREIVAGTSDVLAAVKERFDGPGDAIEAEVKAFLADLQAKGLLAE